MKIDIHTHTRKCKSGDAPTREISAKDFCDTILSTDVRVVAITNHNVFDLAQFRAIAAILTKEAQVWPGIELDILDNGSRGHLLVIVSPEVTERFSEAVLRLVNGKHPDHFEASIDDVLRTFDELGPLYVAHYRQKKPNLSDEALEALQSRTRHPPRVIKEVTNSISAGIYISHGHASIYGSDVHDWTSYEDHSHELPELRLPVDSFEHFCLLLEKDPTTINTALNRKTSETLSLSPFDDGSALSLKVFDDINVIFGSKGTGKSCILKSLAKHYSAKGIDAKVYESASDRLDEIFDTKGRELTINLNPYGINYCTDEIKCLRDAREVDVTSVTKYATYFAATTTNRNAKKLLLKEINLEEDSSAKREFTDFASSVESTASFLTFLEQNTSVRKELHEQELAEVTQILTRLLERLKTRAWASFSIWKEISLLNSAVEVFRKEVERKTGSPAKPTTTGFKAYALNRMSIESNAARVLKAVNTPIPAASETVGSLGPEKGQLEFRTEFAFQTGSVTDSTLLSLSGVKKGTQKQFINQVRKIHQHACADDLFHFVADLNSVEEVERVKTVHELLLFRRHFALNGERYSPSSGEASMVMLQKELGTNRDVYLLDEPERSLGNEYINDVIVPLIKERAKVGKKVFISTHDANIAVRTLPYSSVYRCHGPSGYQTYVGNPFSNSLVNAHDSTDRLDWKKVSMRTLEGGEEAFGERGKIYGND